MSSGQSLRREVEKLFEKDRLKDAVKQAKLLFKQESTAEHHQLLERAFFLRARQLLGLGMPDSAVEVARHLLEFGLTSNDWVDEFVRLLMKLGLADEAFEIQGRTGRSDLKDQLVVLAADQAVTHPERMQDVSGDIAREAALVRESLEKLRSGDLEGGVSLLRDLPRSSPLSDWKFFVRGLAAHYGGNAEECQANWDRLDGRRKAFQIATRLRALAQPGVGGGDLALIEKEVFGEPVLVRLEALREYVASREWDTVNRMLVSLRHSLRRLDSRLAERLTRILMPFYIRDASDAELDDAERLLKNFARLAEPMAIDPSWNRFWGIAEDVAQGDPNASRDYWKSYAHDLETMPALGTAERPIAEALVWIHVAELIQEEIEDLDAPESMNGMLARFFSEAVDLGEVARLKQEALECLEKSLALAPQRVETYRRLISLHAKWKNRPGLDAAAKRLLEKFPEDVETLTLFLEAKLLRGELEEAMGYIQRARVLKPLDAELREREATTRIGLARECALARRWDEGRDQFRAAEELSPDLRQQYFYLARKARLRGESERARRERAVPARGPGPASRANAGVAGSGSGGDALRVLCRHDRALLGALDR